MLMSRRMYQPCSISKALPFSDLNVSSLWTWTNNPCLCKLRDSSILGCPYNYFTLEVVPAQLSGTILLFISMCCFPFIY